MTNFCKKSLVLAVLVLLISAVNASAATFTVTNTNDSGAGSLRQAVLDANAAASADTIVFDASFNTARTINLATVIAISPADSVDNLTITGPGANLLTIAVNGNARVFTNGFANGGVADTLSISGMTITRIGTVSSDAAAAVQNAAVLTVTGVVFNSIMGGAIDNTNNISRSTLTVTNCVFNSNTAGFTGGAIYNNGIATVTNSTLNSNTAAYGGAIGNNDSLTVSGSTFTNNISGVSFGGGAIYNSTNQAANITNSTFTGNQTGGAGGAIVNRSGSMTVGNSIFTNNSAVSAGGAIQNAEILSVSGSTFTNNSSNGANAQQSGQGSGGAISNQFGGRVTIADSIITGNSAANFGGGIYYQPNSPDTALLTITNSTISNNTANSNSDTTGDGGGLFLQGGGPAAIITGSTISGNTANSGEPVGFGNGRAGGIWSEVMMIMTNSTVSGNVAQRSVGGIYITNINNFNGATMSFTNSTIAANRSAASGIGIFFNNTYSNVTVNLRSSIIANNGDNGASPDLNGSFNSQGYNLIRNTTGATISGTTTGNITGVDPLLAPLRSNGGLTRTHALLPGSPAIDTGDPATFPATDQRGIARPQDGDGNGAARADIGAYERRPNEAVSTGYFDFDGDGRSDVSVFRPSNGAWYLNNSQTGFSAVQFGSSSDSIAPADFDGDGKTDVAVFRNGTWYALQSSNSAILSVGFGIAGDLPRPGDFDGDGKADISVFRPSNGSWYRFNSSSGAFVAVQFGTNGDRPLVGDFDGDGKSDIAVYRPSNGVWYRLNSSNGQFNAIQFGATGDIPTPADFDGDGKTDVSVFRPSNGAWYRFNSATGQFFAVQFGSSGDQPAAADYDGDGKDDVAVFRPSNGIWYQLRSTAGFGSIQFGANGDTAIPSAFVQ